MSSSRNDDDFDIFLQLLDDEVPDQELLAVMEENERTSEDEVRMMERHGLYFCLILEETTAAVAAAAAVGAAAAAAVKPTRETIVVAVRAAREAAAAARAKAATAAARDAATAAKTKREVEVATNATGAEEAAVARSVAVVVAARVRDAAREAAAVAKTAREATARTAREEATATRAIRDAARAATSAMKARAAAARAEGYLRDRMLVASPPTVGMKRSLSEGLTTTGDVEAKRQKSYSGVKPITEKKRRLQGNYRVDIEVYRGGKDLHIWQNGYDTIEDAARAADYFRVAAKGGPVSSASLSAINFPGDVASYLEIGGVPAYVFEVLRLKNWVSPLINRPPDVYSL